MTPEDTNKKTEQTPAPEMELEWLDDFAPEAPKAAEEPPKAAEPKQEKEAPKPEKETPKPEKEVPKPAEEPPKAEEPKPEKEAPKPAEEPPKATEPKPAEKEEQPRAEAAEKSEADLLAEARHKREKKKAAAERRRQEEEQRKKKHVSTLLMVICIIVAIGSSALVIRAVYYYQNARSTYGNAEDSAVSALTTDTPAPIDADPVVVQPAEGGTEAGRPEGAVLEIDFAALKEINPDVVAWLHVPALDLSYPVMQGEDNEYYLTHTLEDEYNPLGSIFMECTNLPDFSHGNTLIYGHNTADGTMFGRLREFGQDPSLRENHPFFYIYQADGTIGKYRIYSYYSVYKEGDSFAWFTDPESYDYYVNLTKNLSIEPIEADFTDRPGLVTLSTCFGASGTPYRFLVHGVRE